MATLLHNGRLFYDNPQSRYRQQAYCVWLLWRREDGTYVSLVIDCETNPGPSVTNAAEAIADTIYRQVKNTRPDPTCSTEIRFFEAYPRYLYGELVAVDEVLFTRVQYPYDHRHPRDPVYAVHSQPGWQPLPMANFVALIGVVLTQELLQTTYPLAIPGADL